VRTLATTRLAETWIHIGGVADPLGVVLTPGPQLGRCGLDWAERHPRAGGYSVAQALTAANEFSGVVERLTTES
jgi:hypothetical protein